MRNNGSALVLPLEGGQLTAKAAITISGTKHKTYYNPPATHASTPPDSVHAAVVSHLNNKIHVQCVHLHVCIFNEDLTDIR